MNFNPNNPATYKPARKKQYDIHMGLPALEAVFCNKFEQPQVATRYPFQPDRCLLTGRDVYHLQRYARKMPEAAEEYARLKQWASQGLLYTASSKTKDRVILAGTQGELWTIKLNKLAQTYDIVNSDNSVSPITPQSLSAKMVNGEMDWTRIRTKKDAGVVMACFVPVGYQMQIKTSWGAVLTVNANGVPHGKGDFIMASCNPDGTPNMNDRWVVNGLIFRDTYDNRGWSNYLEVQAADAVQQQVRLPSLGIGESIYSSENEEFMANVSKVFGSGMPVYDGDTPSAKGTPAFLYAFNLAAYIDKYRSEIFSYAACLSVSKAHAHYAKLCSEMFAKFGAQYRTPEVVAASKGSRVCYSKFDFVRYEETLQFMLMYSFFNFLVDFYCSGQRFMYESEANTANTEEAENKKLCWQNCANFLAKYPKGMKNWVTDFIELPRTTNDAMTPDAVGRFFRVELFPALATVNCNYRAYLTFYCYKERADSNFFTLKADMFLRNVRGLNMTDPRTRHIDSKDMISRVELNPYALLGYGSSSMLSTTRQKIAKFVAKVNAVAHF